ncbi:hypothetical protein ABBQ32_008231 [Trebouxia sp. C0010 RCD-2024]
MSKFVWIAMYDRCRAASHAQSLACLTAGEASAALCGIRLPSSNAQDAAAEGAREFGCLESGVFLQSCLKPIAWMLVSFRMIAPWLRCQHRCQKLLRLQICCCDLILVTYRYNSCVIMFYFTYLPFWIR